MSPADEWKAAHKVARAIPRCAGRGKNAAISRLLAMLLDLLRGRRLWS